MNHEVVLKVGDKMQWSLDLIQQTLDRPLQRTEKLVVVGIDVVSGTDDLGEFKRVTMARLEEGQ